MNTKFNQAIRIALTAVVIAPCAAPAQSAGTKPAASEVETDFRPEKYSPLRYRTATENSAFEREILPPAKGPEGPPPTPFDLSLVGVAGKAGNYRVTLVDKKKKYVVVTSEPNADGYHYTAIEPAANVQDIRVQIAKDGQTEWAEFDTSRYSIAAKPVAPPKKTTTRRPSVVPTNRKPPTPRATSTQTAAATKSAGAAVSAIEKANAAARAAGAEKAKSRVNGRRVVLPPKSR